MRKYVPYIRTAEGYIERISYAIYNCYNCSDGSLDPSNCSDYFLAPYAHEEPLVGWPESKVYWAKNDGPSVGIAPVIDL